MSQRVLAGSKVLGYHVTKAGDGVAFAGPGVLVGPAHGGRWVPSGRGSCGFERWELGALLWPDHMLPQTGQLEPLLSQFTEEEELQMTRMLQRMDILAKVEDPGMCPERVGGTCLT